jgi:hypothetical protein
VFVISFKRLQLQTWINVKKVASCLHLLLRLLIPLVDLCSCQDIENKIYSSIIYQLNITSVSQQLFASTTTRFIHSIEKNMKQKQAKENLKKKKLIYTGFNCRASLVKINSIIIQRQTKDDNGRSRRQSTTAKLREATTRLRISTFPIPLNKQWSYGGVRF